MAQVFNTDSKNTDNRNYNIALIKGDGIGPEIIDATLLVLDAVAKKFGISLTYENFLMGACAYDAVGNPLPDETLAGAKKADAVLFGAIGDPRCDTLPRHLRPESALLKLRKELGLFANIRPAMVFDELADASALKKEVVAGVDLIVVRELTGGIYFGEPRKKEDNKAYNTMIYSTHEVERIARVAFELAKKRSGRVCSVDKANVLEVSQFWREVVERVGADYPGVALTHMYVDNAAMQLVRAPKQFDILLTSNLFGDILSDEASMLTGSIGLLPSASVGEKHRLYEPIHGSAPDIAGKGVANPIATILSAAMMLRDLGEDRAAIAIESAIKTALKNGARTGDIAAFAPESSADSKLESSADSALKPAQKPLSTKEMAEQIITHL